MMSRMKCACLVLMLLFVAVSALADEPRAERITVLQPAPDAEVIRDFFVLELEGGGRKVTTAPRKHIGAPRKPVEQAFEWEVDLERATYTTRIVSPNAADIAMRERIRGKEERGGRRFRAAAECSEYDTGDDWIPCEDETRAQGWKYTVGLETRYPTSWGAYVTATRTEAELHWKACDGGLEKDFFDGFCSAYSPWRYDRCGKMPPYQRGFMDAKVVGMYNNYSLWNPAIETVIYDEVTLEAGHGAAWGTADFVYYGEAPARILGYQYESPVYGYQAYCSGTGGGGAGDSGSGGSFVEYPETYCVPVYNGENGAKLGDCCGTNNTQIINCAKSYLN